MLGPRAGHPPSEGHGSEDYGPGSAPGAEPRHAASEACSTRPREPTLKRIPAHLRRYVVEQNYAEYNAVDQAVWRFVLAQISDTLRRTAHRAYEQGLEQTGIDLERIPRIEQMDRCLASFGWGAVCVDGFIPPRAFVEFQALGILPIAADIRTRKHLVYTPAPDIIHEAAGHAPILPDPGYAAYLKRIGRVGSMAFSSPEDDRVYRAIYRLSEMKERPESTPEAIARAEREFNEAVEGVTRTTEAARMSRLYWWTAEYGLVGTPENYELYGAGLLSSLGESHFCHQSNVQKRPLGVECLDVAYDITRAQPQLFVARDFEHLEEVLDAAQRTLAAYQGGVEGVREAERSGEVATLTLGDSSGDDAVEVVGVVHRHQMRDGLLRIALHAGALAPGGRLQRRLPEQAVSTLLVGPSNTNWRSLRCHRDEALELDFGFAILAGRFAFTVRGQDDRNLVVGLENARLGDEHLGSLTLVAGPTVLGVRAGASDPAYHTPSDYPGHFVPARRTFDAEEQELLALYEEATKLAREAFGATAAQTVAHLHEQLRRSHPDEWLLRWNLLELLLRQDTQHASYRPLWEELERLELRFDHAEPIALGLRHLARLAGAR